MKTVAHDGRETAPRSLGGLIGGLVIILVLAAAIWGAWRLGVMAGDRVDWRQTLPLAPSIPRKAPNPQPIPIPTRRPGVEAQARR